MREVKVSKGNPDAKLLGHIPNATALAWQNQSKTLKTSQASGDRREPEAGFTKGRGSPGGGDCSSMSGGGMGALLNLHCSFLLSQLQDGLKIPTLQGCLRPGDTFNSPQALRLAVSTCLSVRRKKTGGQIQNNWKVLANVESTKKKKKTESNSSRSLAKLCKAFYFHNHVVQNPVC